MPPVAVVTDSTSYLPPELIERHGIDGRPPLRRLRRRPHRARGRDHRLPGVLRGAPQRGEAAHHLAAVASATSPPPSSRCSRRAARSCRCTSPAACPARPRPPARPRRRSRATARAASGSRWSTPPPPRAGSASWCSPPRRRRATARARRRSPRTWPRRASELKLWFAIDTLEFLKRGGRIGAASAWIGSTLKVKPILTVENEMTPVERVRTSRADVRAPGRLRARVRRLGRRRVVRAAHQRARPVRRARGALPARSSARRRRSSARSGRCCRRTPGPGCSAGRRAQALRASRRPARRGEYRPWCSASGTSCASCS